MFDWKVQGMISAQPFSENTVFGPKIHGFHSWSNNRWHPFLIQYNQWHSFLIQQYIEDILLKAHEISLIEQQSIRVSWIGIQANPFQLIMYGASVYPRKPLLIEQSMALFIFQENLE